MYTVTNRAATIASIIEKRRPLAEKIALVENNLQTLFDALRSLEEHRKQLLTQVDDDVIGRLRDIDLTSWQSRIGNECKALSQLKARFCRKTLNIGVVGLARQGKSRLLQSLTGLTTAEIPDGDGQHCTGVRSTIYHNPSTETYAEVLFHSERSFLNEVIAPYYEKLQLGAKATSLEEFSHKSLPALPKHISDSTKLGAMYEHLQRYYINFDKYQRLLRETSALRISRNQIREYVAQDTLDGQRIYFNYLAVKEVKIFCQFPNADIGNIALVDMPGLGDTGIGDEERLMKTLGQDVDAVLFVRMPKPSGDYWGKSDVELYDTARASLPDLPLELWSFMVLNRIGGNPQLGDNLNNCKGLAGDITNKHIKVINPFIANCASLEEAGGVLDNVLNYLTNKINDLDEKYASTCQQKLTQLQSHIFAELQECQNIFTSEEQTDEEDEIFESLFEEFWNTLTSSLLSLVTEFKEQSDNDNDFLFSINDTIANCKSNTAIPSDLREIKQKHDSMGSYNKAYDQYLDEVRTRLTQHFLTLDKGLNCSIEKAQKMVAHVLLEQGGLRGLTEKRGIEFLKFMAEELPEKHNNLKRSFQLLSTFELSFRGLVQPRIRKHLNDLRPDAKVIRLSSSLLEEKMQKEIQENLQILHAEALYKCKESLNSMLSEPSQAALAIVEEFVDQALRAKGVNKEWRLFLKKQKSKVWSEKFAQLNQQSEIRQRWLDIVRKAILANQVEFMQFLNCI